MIRLPVQVLVFPVRFIDRGWQYLLLRRIPKLGGFWQGITGGINQGEELLAAANRELAEETGNKHAKLEKIGYSYTYPVQDEWRHLYATGVEEIREHVFIALVDGQQDPRISREHDRWQWCEYQLARRLLFWPENIEALDRCQDFIRTQIREQ